MLHTKFQVVVKKKIFEYISTYFYGSNTGRPRTRLFYTRPGHHLNKLGKARLGHARYQKSTRVRWFWRRKILIFFNVFLLFKPRTPCCGAILDARGGAGWHHLNKLGIWPLGHVQEPEPTGLQEEDVRIFFCVFLWFKPRTPWPDAILDPWGIIWTVLVKHHWPMLCTKFKAPKSSGSKEENVWIFFYIFLWFKPRTPYCEATIYTNLVRDY